MLQLQATSVFLLLLLLSSIAPITEFIMEADIMEVDIMEAHTMEEVMDPTATLTDAMDHVTDNRQPLEVNTVDICKNIFL